MRFGIRAQLMVAFAAVVSTTLIAAGVGLWSTQSVSNQTHAVTAQQMPAVTGVALLQLSTADVAAAAARLARVENEEERTKAITVLVEAMERLKTALAALEARKMFDTASFAAELNALDIAEKKLEQLVRQRLAKTAERDARIASLNVTREDFALAVLGPSESAIQVLALAAKDLPQTADYEITGVLDSFVQVLIPLLESGRNSVKLMQLVQTGATATDVASVYAAWTDYVPALLQLSQTGQVLQQGEDVKLKAVGQKMSQLASTLSEPVDIFDVMRASVDPAKSADERATAQKSVAERVAKAQKEYAVVDQSLGPAITGTRASIVIRGRDLSYTIEEAMKTFIGKDIANYQRLLQLSASTNYLVSLLAESASADSGDRINNLEAQIQEGTDAIENIVKTMDINTYGAIVLAAQKLMTFAEGAESLPSLRREQLDLISFSAAAVADTSERATRMVAAAEALSASARAQADAAGVAVEQAAVQAKNLLWVIVIGSLILAVLIVWLYVGRRIVARLTLLADAMRKIAGGDLNVATNVSGEDEVGEMAQALEVFRSNASEIANAQAEAQAARDRSIAERRQARLEMADGFEASVKQVVDRVTNAVQGLRRTAETVGQSADDTMREASAAADSSQRATHSVHTVAAAAEQLLSSIREIGTQVQRSSNATQKAVTDAQDTQNTVTELSQSAQRIDEVVKLINGIAAQTNLLALNATIEAARAGDAGKGFAVVAGEVKNLANQTAQATEEISQQIAAVQSSTGAVVGAISQIAKTVTELNEISSVIAAAVEQQGAATQEIARSVDEAAGNTGDALGRIDMVRGAAETAGQSATDLNTAARSMAEDADALNHEVDGFLKQIRA
ncbi:methyl-accepting chemotaxis protein [Lacibacterium aquatile]|uniref:Methyl-accepting chemotaxis protein n=1 Tax=Lacibacterium aquatile TaxID=1168082 RepID=A0ABW5DQ54_9PROT